MKLPYELLFLYLNYDYIAMNHDNTWFAYDCEPSPSYDINKWIPNNEDKKPPINLSNLFDLESDEFECWDSSLKRNYSR